MAKKSIAVLGLGQFGRAIVEELVDNGMDVIAIDNNEECANKVASFLPTVFVADCTNEDAMKELGINECDVAIVAFGDNIQASILTTVILKEMGVPRIVVRVDDDYFSKIILKLGATEVIAPQKSAGASLANRIYNDDYRDFYKLDEKHSIVSIKVDPNFKGRTLLELNANYKYGISVVLIVRGGTSFVPGGRDFILGDDSVFVVGSNKDIQKFGNFLNEPANIYKKSELAKAEKKKKKSKGAKAEEPAPEE